MNCDDVQPLLPALLDGERPDGVYEHVNGCLCCAREELALRRLAARLRGMGAEPGSPPAAALERIRAAAAAEGLHLSEGRGARQVRWHLGRWGSVAAAVLLAVTGYWLGRASTHRGGSRSVPSVTAGGARPPAARTRGAAAIAEVDRSEAPSARRSARWVAARVWSLDDRFAALAPRREPPPAPAPKRATSRRSIWSRY